MRISSVKYFLSSMLILSVVGSFQPLLADPSHENSDCHKGGIIEATNAGNFRDVCGSFTIGQPTVVDPLLVGIPNNQSAFALRIPITFTNRMSTTPSIVATYAVKTASLIGKTLTGKLATGTVETVEVSVSAVTNQGFILNIGFFSFFDPGFDSSNITSLISQLGAQNFGISFQTT
jgi:hypothetical protein